MLHLLQYCWIITFGRYSSFCCCVSYTQFSGQFNIRLTLLVLFITLQFIRDNAKVLQKLHRYMNGASILTSCLFPSLGLLTVIRAMKWWSYEKSSIHLSICLRNCFSVCLGFFYGIAHRIFLIFCMKLQQHNGKNWSTIISTTFFYWNFWG